MWRYLTVIGVPILLESLNFLISHLAEKDSPFIPVSFLIYAFLALYIGYRAVIKLDASLKLCAQLSGMVAVTDFFLATPIVFFGWPLLLTLRQEPMVVNAFVLFSIVSLLFTALLGVLGGYLGRVLIKSIGKNKRL